VDPEEPDPPSDERAISKFVKAAQALGMSAWTIGKDEYADLAEFDGLFIRETTNVNHHTYRFARRAHAEGLVVIDDPDSILRCTNKVYLKELLDRHKIPTPKTVIVHRDNVVAVSETLGFPIILKRPDSAFSQGVIKVTNEEELREQAAQMLTKSDLIIAQEYLPTEFDWRVGILDGEPLYVAKYFMAPGHWQIVQYNRRGHGKVEGKVEAVRIEDAPAPVLKTALRAARLIGDGLYGVDLKSNGKKTYVVEINDNPSIEVGFEDAIAGDLLYEKIMGYFLRRLDARAAGRDAV
jgi:glutathione synthase/RimK-type ligase-like ATP-grasp enzyme